MPNPVVVTEDLDKKEYDLCSVSESDENEDKQSISTTSTPAPTYTEEALLDLNSTPSPTSMASIGALPNTFSKKDLDPQFLNMYKNEDHNLLPLIKRIASATEESAEEATDAALLMAYGAKLVKNAATSLQEQFENAARYADDRAWEAWAGIADLASSVMQNDAEKAELVEEECKEIAEDANLLRIASSLVERAIGEHREIIKRFDPPTTGTLTEHSIDQNSMTDTITESAPSTNVQLRMNLLV